MADFAGFSEEEENNADKVRRLSDLNDEIGNTLDTIETDVSVIVSSQESDRSVNLEFWQHFQGLVSVWDTSQSVEEEDGKQKLIAIKD